MYNIYSKNRNNFFKKKKKGTSSKKKGNPEEENCISTFCTKNIVSTGTKQQLKSCHTSGIVWTFY